MEKRKAKPVGKKEQALRELREAKPKTLKLGKSVVIVAIPQKCTIDHDAPDCGIPKELCAVCNPRPATDLSTVKGNAPRDAGNAPRDFRIPKGMSTEEGNAMLAERENGLKEKSRAALKSLKEKQETEFVRINSLREKTGIPPLPEQYMNLMKMDPDRNDRLYARAEPGPAPGPSTPSPKPERGRKPSERVAGGSSGGKAGQSTPKPKEPTGSVARSKSGGSKPPQGVDRGGSGGRGGQPTPVINESIGGVPIPKLRGVFTPPAIKTLMALLKKGTTAKAMYESVQWSDCYDPVMRVARFVEDVAEGHFKAKVSKSGRGPDTSYKID